MESCIDQTALSPLAHATSKAFTQRFALRAPSSELAIFTRCPLAEESLGADAPAVLLEGSWPAGAGDGQLSLDDMLDARFAWIDDEAARLSDEVCRRPVWRYQGRGLADGVGLAWLNALALRYHLVKLVRVVAFFDELWRKGAPAAVELHAARNSDEAYAGILDNVCQRHGTALRVVWRAMSTRTTRSDPPPPWWRRLASVANGVGGAWRSRRGNRPRIVFCGNPGVLDPLATELSARAAAIGWLYDRFAVRGWLRWFPRGAEQLTCDSWAAHASRFVPGSPLGPIECHGCDLASPVGQWLATLAATHGARQSRLLARIGAHFGRLKPDGLVLDEDVTPLARAALAVARESGVPSLVVQHGAPYGRLSYTPLAADRILVWGEASRRQFLHWGVPAGRVEITGSCRHDRLWHHGAAKARPGDRRHGRTRIVLVATNPPADERPDAVAFHLTSRTHRDMLRAACAAVAGLPDAELVVKLHPRCRDVEVFQQALAEFPSLRSRLVRWGDVAEFLDGAACVLSCGSSAGIEAAALGLPVIELLPAGSGELLPADEWGFVGVARSRTELEALLAQALATGPSDNRRSASLLANIDRPAALQAADAVLRACTAKGYVNYANLGASPAAQGPAIAQGSGDLGRAGA